MHTFEESPTWKRTVVVLSVPTLVALVVFFGFGVPLPSWMRISHWFAQIDWIPVLQIGAVIMIMLMVLVSVLLLGAVAFGTSDFNEWLFNGRRTFKARTRCGAQILLALALLIALRASFQAYLDEAESEIYFLQGVGFAALSVGVVVAGTAATWSLVNLKQRSSQEKATELAAAE